MLPQSPSDGFPQKKFWALERRPHAIVQQLQIRVALET
jgi:hypothetical protein